MVPQQAVALPLLGGRNCDDTIMVARATRPRRALAPACVRTFGQYCGCRAAQENRVVLSVDDRRPLFGKRWVLQRDDGWDDADLNPRTGRWLRGEWALRGAELNTVSARLGLNPSAPPHQAGRNEPARAFEIDARLLARIFPALGAQRAAKFVDALNLYLPRYEIDSVARMSAFFGQVSVESVQMTALVENMNYSVKGLMDTHPRRVPDLDTAQRLAGKPEVTANHLYVNKNGNGDEASGDGWRFRGRGLLHLTWRENYRRFSAHSGIDIEGKPELVELPTYAVWTACWYWAWHRFGLNDLADKGDLKKLTLAVNGGQNGLHDRGVASEKSFRALRSESFLGRAGYGL